MENDLKSYFLPALLEIFILLIYNENPSTKNLSLSLEYIL